jgi:hypothetical protein
MLGPVNSLLARLRASLRPRHRFSGLLLALWSLLVLPPLLQPFTGSWTSLLTILAFVIPVGRTLAFETRLGRAARAALWLIVLVSLLRELEILSVAPMTHVVGPVALACTSAFLTVEILYFVLSPRGAPLDRIFAACCAYLLLGLAFSGVYELLELTLPGSISAGVSDRVGRRGELLYFSLITLTSTGFGDLLPRLPLARMVAASEALVGQLFIAVVIARLVGNVTTPDEGSEKPEAK